MLDRGVDGVVARIWIVYPPRARVARLAPENLRVAALVQAGLIPNLPEANLILVTCDHLVHVGGKEITIIVGCAVGSTVPNGLVDTLE